MSLVRNGARLAATFRPVPGAFGLRPSAWGMGQRILIIDDERSVHDVARAYLEREGYEVLSAMGGRDGLALAQAAQPALVVLDLMLTDLGGEQVCAELHRESDVAIVLPTAKSTKENCIRGMYFGADDYVTLAFSPRAL